MPGDDYIVQNQLQGQRKAEEYTRFAQKVVGRGAQRQWLARLDEKLKDYNTTANRLAAQPTVSRQDLTALRDQALEITKVCATYLSTKAGKEKTAFNDAFRNVGRTMQKDYKTMENARADGTTSFNDVIRSSKERTIRLGEQQGERLGGNLSQRMLLQVRDNNGKMVKGLFTQSSALDYVKRTDDDLARWKQEYPELDPMFKELNTARVAYNKSHKKSMSMGEYMAEHFSGYVRSDGTSEVNMDNDVKDICKKYKQLPAYRNWLKSYGKDAFTRNLQHKAYARDHGLGQGANIDGRNSAMTAMADLLHCGDLLARATPMAVKDADGKTVHGTFMNFAEGSDLTRLTLDDPYLHSDPEHFTTPAALKSIANLTALDFICGNTDRHQGNMLYQFDENNQLIGVKGIDNDLSFGHLSNRALQKGLAQMSGLSDIQVMGKDMADAVKSVTPDMLKVALRGYGLDEKELDSAVKRLNMVKGALETGAIKSVADNEWGNYSLMGLAENTNGGRNPYIHVFYESVNQKMHRSETEAMYRENNAPKALNFGDASFEKSAENYDKLSKQMGKFYQRLKDVNSGFFISSTEFNNMKNYTEFMRDEFGRMAKQTPPEGVDRETFRKAQFEKSKLMMDSLRDLSSMYLNHRESDGKLKTNSTAQKRALAATELNAMARNNGNRFSLPDDELYREAMAENRKNAYKEMSPKEIATRIKNTIKMAKQHANDPLYQNEAQKNLNRYFGQVMGKDMTKYGIPPEAIPPQNRQNQPQNRRVAGNPPQNRSRAGGQNQKFKNELEKKLKNQAKQQRMPGT